MIHMNSLRIAVTAIVGIMVFMSSLASAQRGPDSLRAERHVDMLKERLKLSDEQTAKIRDIIMNEHKNGRPERGFGNGDRETAMKAREARRKAADEKIKAVLNDDQKKEFDKIKDELRPDPRKKGQNGKDHNGKGERPNGDPRGAGMNPEGERPGR